MGFVLIDLCSPSSILRILDQDRDRDRNDRSDRNDRNDRNDRSGRRDGPRGSRQPPPSDDRRSREFQNVPTAPRAERSNAPTRTGTPSTPVGVSSPGSMGPPAAPTLDPTGSADYTPPMTDTDLSAIRSRYLGVDKKKRKIRKMNDRKFVFDWDAQDDTFAADSPVAVGSNRQGAQVMFGRGRLAGMDDGGGSGPRKTADGPHAVHLADAMERRNAAKAGYDDRHWTDKPLNEMKERDWRIFREDFSISARGLYISFPVSIHY